MLEQALAVRASARTELRARALYEAAHLAFYYERNMPLEQLAEESFTLFQELDNAVDIATCLILYGAIARIRSQFALALNRLEEATDRFKTLNNRWRQGQCLTERGRVATEQGKFEQAWILLSESLQHYQDLGDAQRIAWVSFLQARLLFVSQQDQVLAQQLAERSLTNFRQLGDTPNGAFALGLLGLIYLEREELAAAPAYARREPGAQQAGRSGNGNRPDEAWPGTPARLAGRYRRRTAVVPGGPGSAV